MEQEVLGEVHKPPRTWRVWIPAVAALLLALAIVQLAMLAGLQAASMFDVAADYSTPGAHPPGHFETLQAQRLGAYFAGFQLTVVTLTLLAAFLTPPLRGRVLLFSRPRGGIAAIGLAILGLLAISSAIGTLIYQLDRTTFIHDIRPFAHIASSSSWWMLLLAAGVGAPLSEELLFRGLLFGGLRDSPLGFVGAAGISAGFWTALHASYSIYALALLFVIGIYFAWLRERTQSLWPSMAGHAVYNSAIVLALAFAPDVVLQ
ncbi:MAG: lysostaphin resistance A-like protein [Hyphomicrobium sp.]